jgi:FkbM family methyltransferase
MAAPTLGARLMSTTERKRIEPRTFLETGILDPMVSYAQNFEDVTLRRALQDIEKGLWVDIGAHHGTFHSVTRYFSGRGWTGINVEPNPEVMPALRAERPNDINVQAAIGRQHGKIRLHVIGDTGLTTTMQDLAVRHAKNGHPTTSAIDVNLIPLESLFNLHCRDKTIDFLTVDAEGAESEILVHYAFVSHRPRIIVAEAASDSRYHQHLQDHGYIFTWYDALNYWYVREEDEWRCDMIARPPSVWDNFHKAA